jgi:hypothetical protein
VKLDPEIDRLYGLPLDEFVAQRDALAKTLRRGGEREAAAAVKALRKPTAGAWALNQAVRRRRRETSELLEAGARLRAAHSALLAGGDRADLREAMDQERSVAAVLADCAEAIASETGKSGPTLRERVRATLHAAALDETVRDELATGRLVREHEAVGLGASLGAEAAASGGSPPPGRARARAGGRRAKDGRAEADATPAQAGRTVDRAAQARARERAARLAEAERSLGEAEAALREARRAHGRAADQLERARTSQREAEAAERDARKLLREREREHAKREREHNRLRG